MSIEVQSGYYPWRTFGNFTQSEIQKATPLLDASGIAYFVDDTLRNFLPAYILFELVIHEDHWDRAVSLLAPALKPNSETT